MGMFSSATVFNVILLGENSSIRRRIIQHLPNVRGFFAYLKDRSFFSVRTSANYQGGNRCIICYHTSAGFSITVCSVCGIVTDCDLP